MNTVTEDLAPLRQTMVDCQLRTFDVTDADVLVRFSSVPREIFLPKHLQPMAYSDCAVEIANDRGRRRLLVPMVLARMVQSAAITPEDKVLCIGDGSGYGAAIIAGLAGDVIALDNNEIFTRQASGAFERLGLTNARAVTGALHAGLTSAAPFDVIIVCGAIDSAPVNLLRQLSDKGRMLAIENASPSASGPAGQVVRYDNAHGVNGRLALFCAHAPLLPGFEPKRSFVF